MVCSLLLGVACAHQAPPVDSPEQQTPSVDSPDRRAQTANSEPAPDHIHRLAHHDAPCPDDGELRDHLGECVSAGPLAADTCTNTCRSAHDGNCDDGGHDTFYFFCELGTDCADCGLRPAGSIIPDRPSPASVLSTPAGNGCTNVCFTANDDKCDDGGPGSPYELCALGTGLRRLRTAPCSGRHYRALNPQRRRQRRERVDHNEGRTSSTGRKGALAGAQAAAKSRSSCRSGAGRARGTVLSTARMSSASVATAMTRIAL
ncbi:MAG: hypothetical protein ACI9KE_002293 [Polyangiales bacterium]|jgi:hypothetical protein